MQPCGLDGERVHLHPLALARLNRTRSEVTPQFDKVGEVVGKEPPYTYLVRILSIDTVVRVSGSDFTVVEPSIIPCARFSAQAGAR